MIKITDYQREQFEALRLVREHLPGVKADLFSESSASVARYLEFRDETDRFLATHFSDLCTQSCYRNRLSACCSKDGIITFFADVVINALHSDADTLDRMETRLQEPNTGGKCIYLGSSGCLWNIKPVVCQMFLCDRAEKEVFGPDASAKTKWEFLKQRKQDFTWPDKPVLFDRIEALFMGKGCKSSLMYLHNSPGLLRLKRKAGLI